MRGQQNGSTGNRHLQPSLEIRVWFLEPTQWERTDSSKLPSGLHVCTMAAYTPHYGRGRRELGGQGKKQNKLGQEIQAGRRGQSWMISLNLVGAENCYHWAATMAHPGICFWGLPRLADGSLVHQFSRESIRRKTVAVPCPSDSPLTFQAVSLVLFLWLAGTAESALKYLQDICLPLRPS